MADGVAFTANQGERAVAWLNAATPDELEAAGIYDRGVGVILQSRPFHDLVHVAETPGIGTKTMEAVAAAIPR